MNQPAPHSTQRRVLRVEHSRTVADHDLLAVEEPLEIRIGAEPIAVTMRTPGHDRDLAAGFCLTEGIIADSDELESVTPCGQAAHGNVVLVTLTESAARRRAAHVSRAQRAIYISSSCGLCGKQSIDRLHQQAPPIRGDFQIARSILSRLPDAMHAHQAGFAQTGGLHAAALYDLHGQLKLIREDVGRHNAVDKVLGASLVLGRLPLNRSILLVSGRLSFEIVQKAAMAGLALVAAVSAPSSLAVDLAARLNITLVGFLRDGRMNVYHDAGRILDQQPS